MPVTTGPKKRETITTTVYLETEYGPVEERGIREGDWRDPDLIQEIPISARVYPKDQGFADHSGAAEPNWRLGATVMDNANNRILMDFEAGPPEFFRECHKRGLAVTGILIGRDEQMHN